MSKQWQELKETIAELRDNDGTGTQQEVCKFLANLMDVLEKQMQEPCEDAISRQAAIDENPSSFSHDHENDLISRQAAIDAVRKAYENDEMFDGYECRLRNLPSAQPERTEYIPDTKDVPSKRDYVDLAERVTATFFDHEHEEWTQLIVTIADVLDSVCDEYTILPSAQPKIGKWILSGGYWRCSECKEKALLKLDKAKGNCKEYEPVRSIFCPNCGMKMLQTDS